VKQGDDLYISDIQVDICMLQQCFILFWGRSKGLFFSTSRQITTKPERHLYYASTNKQQGNAQAHIDKIEVINTKIG